MSWSTKKIGELITPSGHDRAGSNDYPVLSITMHDGLVDQSSKFKKRIASRDTASYRVVYSNELVVGFPIDEGVLGFQTKYPAGIVSPAYGVWKLTLPQQTHVPFLEGYLRSGVARKIYASKMRRGVARRRTISKDAFLDIDVPFPPRHEQARIAAVLRKANVLRRQRQESIRLTEKLLQSVFIEMFGDPATNPRDWPMLELRNFGIVQTGNTPPRSNRANYSATGLEWIKTDNIVEDRVVVTASAERLSETGVKAARVAPAGSLLVACIAGSERSIGRAALTDRRVAFNQQINAITPHADTSSLFLYFLIKLARRQIQSAAAKGMKKIVNKSTFESLRFIAPGYDEQTQFEVIAERLISQKQDCQDQSLDLDAFFLSLQQLSYRGELDLSRLVLDPLDDIAPADASAMPAIQPSKREEGKSLFQVPAALKPALEQLDVTVRSGDAIPWSADYFKYRILATQPAPFSFAALMQSAEPVFEQPLSSESYDQIRELIFDLLGQDGKPVLLRQRFDQREVKEQNPDGKEITSFEGRREIVFEPVS